MFRPEHMTRVAVVGSVDSLDATIACLYEIGALHLIDFNQPDDDFEMGRPLPEASTASQKLLKLRAMKRSLEIEDHRPSRKLTVEEIEGKLDPALVTMDLNISGKTEARQKIVSLVREKEATVRALEPFAAFGLRVEDFRGYGTVAVFSGRCKSDPEQDLRGRVGGFELFKTEHAGEVAIALFTRQSDQAESARVLTDHGYQEVKLPEVEGRIDEVLAKERAAIKELSDDLRRVESELEAARERFADLILASEEHLAIEVSKAETPLRIATSKHSFVIDGWMPTPRVKEIHDALDKICCGLAFVEAVGDAGEDDEDPPVKLRNPLPARPFEFFISLVSTPKYKEVDPTFILFITFPLFFGFMIGDLGFGAGLFAAGAVLRAKMKDSPDMRKLGSIILAGGLGASIFGLFVFAEAFGIPFHPPEGSHDEYSWESVASIPIHPALDKMHDIQELLAISILAGWLHLTAGFVIGVVNNIGHDRKHVVAKVAWLLVLFGLFAQMMVIAGDATRTSALMNDTVMLPLPDVTIAMVGIDVSLPAVALILIGIAVLPLTEGALALTEVVGLFTNLISYTRLAALAVGKGAMALAFNSMLLPLVFDSGNIVIAILGALTLFVTQMFFVFFLGALSAGIQAIRLNYVEFFLKFFEGGGTDFSPLSYVRRYSIGKARRNVGGVERWT